MCISIRSYMVGHDRSGVGVMPLPPPDQIKRIAQATLNFKCPRCGADHAELNKKLPRQ